MNNPITIITENKLSVEDCQNQIMDQKCGGNCIFVGTVRDFNQNKKVIHLEFESYQSMALKELKKIGQEAISKYQCSKVYLAHRVGKVEIGEAAVIVGASSVHRKAAFESCEFLINKLKLRIPIWKKEMYSDGDQWINAHP